MMPLIPVIVVDIFDISDIDFLGPFSNSFGMKYILLCVDYVSKLVKAIPTRTTESKAVVRFLRENTFARYGIRRSVISDQGPISTRGSLMHNLRGIPFSIVLQPHTIYKLTTNGGSE